MPHQFMNRLIAGAIALLPLLICLIVLGLSIYPGGVRNAIASLVFFAIINLNIWLSRLITGDILFLFLLGSVIVVLVWGTLHALGSVNRQNPPSSLFRRWLRGLWVANGVWLALTPILLHYQVPLRIAFLQVKPALMEWIQVEVEVGTSAPINQTIGPYSIAQRIESPDGGIYLSLALPPFYSGYETTYGFVYQPNPHGSPFGGGYERRRHYRLYPLQDEWHWFRDNIGSDDWRNF